MGERVRGVRRVPAVTAEQERFRLEPAGDVAPGVRVVRREFVEPVPVGTVVLMAFRVVGYSRDCDGSALASLEGVDASGLDTGWTLNGIGLGSDSTWMVDRLSDLDGDGPLPGPRARMSPDGRVGDL